MHTSSELNLAGLSTVPILPIRKTADLNFFGNTFPGMDLLFISKSILPGETGWREKLRIPHADNQTECGSYKTGTLHVPLLVYFCNSLNSGEGVYVLLFQHITATNNPSVD